MHEVDRIAGGTFAIVDTRHIRHVGIVGLVKIFAVPAGLEMDLCSKPVLAGGVGHPLGLCLGSSVKAGKRDTVRDWASVLVGHGSCIVGASEGVTGEHTEARRERFDVRSGVAAA